MRVDNSFMVMKSWMITGKNECCFVCLLGWITQVHVDSLDVSEISNLEERREQEKQQTDTPHSVYSFFLLNFGTLFVPFIHLCAFLEHAQHTT